MTSTQGSQASQIALTPSNVNILRLRTDFANYYAPNALRIRDKNAIMRPFALNSVQQKVDTILSHFIKRQRTFLFILKARQTGISTWAEGRIFHRTHMFQNQRNVIMANDYDGSENVYNMSRMYYENLPLFLKPETLYTSKRQLVFENPNKKTRLQDPGLRSKIDVFTAGRSTSGRSFTFNCCHLSEFAFFPDGETLLTSLIPALPALPGHFMIMETTANGAANFAYTQWRDYKESVRKYGESSEKIPIFIAWFDDSSYRREFHSDKHQKNFSQNMTREDRKIQKQFGLSLEQMFWRQTQLDAMGGDLERFMQEYPATDEEAFLTSGRPIFKLVKIAEAEKRCLEPKWVGEISSCGEITKNSEGRLKLWHIPKVGRKYVVGVDTVEASMSNVSFEDTRADQAVISIVDEDSLVQVAEWVGRLNPIEMTPIVRELCKLYNNALAVPEWNSSGQALIYELQKDYWNIYRRERFDQNGIKISEQLGWRTDARTKPMLIETSTFLFHNDYCHINSISLLNEMRVFINTGTEVKTGSAKKGSQDDRVMAWMIAVFVAARGKEVFTPGLKETVETPSRPPLDQSLRTATDAACVDADEWEKIYGVKKSTARRRRNSVDWMCA